jgi:hypothetical protein
LIVCFFIIKDKERAPSAAADLYRFFIGSQGKAEPKAKMATDLKLASLSTPWFLPARERRSLCWSLLMVEVRIYPKKGVG